MSSVVLKVGADVDFSMEGGFIKEESCSDDEDNDQIGNSESVEEITDQGTQNEQKLTMSAGSLNRCICVS